MHKFMQAMTTDRRLDAYHHSLFSAIAFLGQAAPRGTFFDISRKELLPYTGIRSIVTYHKRLKELVYYGYIGYAPSCDPSRCSQAALLI